MAHVPKVSETARAGETRLPGSRVIIRETLDGLGIYNPARLNVPLVLFLLLWLGGWAVGEYFAVSEIMRSGNIFTDAFLLVWVTFWTIGGAFCWWIVLWSLFGSERLFVTSGALVVSKGLGPLRRRTVYPVATVTRLRVSATPHVADSGTVAGIAFEAGGKARRFGIDLGASERLAVLEALQRVLPDDVFADRADGAPA